MRNFYFYCTGHHLFNVFTAHRHIPDFLRYRVAAWHRPGAPYDYKAYLEGWGLYAEYLGHEMNLYEEDPIQLIGYYSNQLHRAANLVIDAGLHMFGWSRQKAVDFLMNNTALQLTDCEYEVDGHLALPGTSPINIL